MVHACSVLLFCVTIDTLVKKLNDVQLPFLRAYVDDATLAAQGLEQVKPAQEAFFSFKLAGIVIDQRNCCFFRQTLPTKSLVCNMPIA